MHIDYVDVGRSELCWSDISISTATIGSTYWGNIFGVCFAWASERGGCLPLRKLNISLVSPGKMTQSCKCYRLVFFFYLCDTVADDHILLIFVLPGTLMENDPISLTWLFCKQVTRSVHVQPARYFAWAGCSARCSPFKFLASHTRIARCRWGHRCFVFCLGFFGCKQWEPLLKWTFLWKKSGKAKAVVVDGIVNPQG